MTVYLHLRQFVPAGNWAYAVSLDHEPPPRSAYGQPVFHTEKGAEAAGRKWLRTTGRSWHGCDPERLTVHVFKWEKAEAAA